MTPNSQSSHPDDADRGYTIGKFAAINKISARMLRHYDKIGLFKPQTVLANGYRSYSSAQIPTISLIKKYQACGFTLAEISQLLGASDATIQQLAQAKQQQLAQQDVQQDQAGELLATLLGDASAPLPSDDAVSVTQQPERHLVCEPAADEADIDTAFARLYHTLASIPVQPAGLALLLCDPDAAATVYRVAVPCAFNTTPAALTRDTLPAGTYLSTLHFGGYDNIAVAYDRLVQYAQQHHQRLVTPFIERYFLDQTFAASSHDYITEISVQMTP